MRIELTTSSLPRKCSTPELQQLERSLKEVSTPKVQLQKSLLLKANKTISKNSYFCGQSRVRTCVLRREQIYSLSPLTTRPSALTISWNSQFLRASGGIRTPDQLITNQLLWPTELHWHWLKYNLIMNFPQNFPYRAIFWEGKGNGKYLMKKFCKENFIANKSIIFWP